MNDLCNACVIFKNAQGNWILLVVEHMNHTFDAGDHILNDQHNIRKTRWIPEYFVFGARLYQLFDSN